MGRMLPNFTLGSNQYILISQYLHTEYPIIKTYENFIKLFQITPYVRDFQTLKQLEGKLMVLLFFSTIPVPDSLYAP